ncbi:hypothetical protein [Rhizobium leguminosarum]|uniref:Uncharacterized protein n=2 Tax=Rhizobium TaxID=379 RepID=A0A179BEU2_RHILE|nr:hypothetical protein [Rhizobium leguminosarum]OAP90218.1 hypothetical protein A4U53_30310 [Rhizobium leguminosarum]
MGRGIDQSKPQMVMLGTLSSGPDSGFLERVIAGPYRFAHGRVIFIRIGDGNEEMKASAFLVCTLTVS